MVYIFNRTIKSLFSKDVFNLLLFSIFITFILLTAIVTIAVTFAVNSEAVSIGWIDKIIDFLIGTGSIIASWFLFPLLAPLIASLFVEKIIKIIDKKEYNSPLAKYKNSQMDLIKDAAKFLFKSMILNILFLPLYLIPLINLIAYYALNSHLLSREFFQMVSFNYMSIKEADKLHLKYKKKIMFFGVLIVFAHNIPLINLIAPIFSIILMIHLFFKIYYANK